MNIERDLEKLGIIPKNALSVEERNYIAKNIADKLATNIHELAEDYNEFYMRIFNCDMYYAHVDDKFKGVFYYYKNNTIYIDENKDITEIDSYMVHENIHYLQNFSKISKKDNRAGVCQFQEFKVFGLGINEAIVQYITAKTLGNDIHRNTNEIITICTNSDNHYKYMTSLIIQIVFLIGDKKAVDSCISSTDKFENELYNVFEENAERIVKNFDLILDENNKPNRDENKIIDIYMQTQQLIYTAYFTKMCKRLTTIKEVDMQVQRLEDYEKIIGKKFNVSYDEDSFRIFKDEMESKYLKKYIEINRNNSKNTLVVYKKMMAKLWNRIIGFIQGKSNKVR